MEWKAKRPSGGDEIQLSKNGSSSEESKNGPKNKNDILVMFFLSFCVNSLNSVFYWPLFEQQCFEIKCDFVYVSWLQLWL